MNVTYHCLRVLRHFLVSDDPQHGAGIMRELKIGAGTLYPMLARLRAAGWIELAGAIAGPNEPTSYFYRLTEKGRDTFLEMLVRLTIPDHLWRKQKD